jgi:hypothetical protein
MKKAKKILPPMYTKKDLDFSSGIIFTGENAPLDFLVIYRNESVFDRDYGQVSFITPKQAATHNEHLSKALIEFLSECDIGEGNLYYIRPNTSNGGYLATTWTGEIIGECFPDPDAEVATMQIKDRLFKGDWQSGSGVCFFVRAS